MHSITVYYFGDLMAKLNIGRETLRIPPTRATVGGLMSLLANRGGDWSGFIQPRSTLHITVNKKDAAADTVLVNGDEVAFIESVSL